MAGAGGAAGVAEPAGGRRGRICAGFWGRWPCCSGCARCRWFSTIRCVCATRWSMRRRWCCWRWLGCLRWSARWRGPSVVAAGRPLRLGIVAGLFGGVQPVCELRNACRQPYYLRRCSSANGKSGRSDCPIPKGVANRCERRGSPLQPRPCSSEQGAAGRSDSPIPKGPAN